jgi:hypothetical protein
MVWHVACDINGRNIDFGKVHPGLYYVIQSLDHVSGFQLHCAGTTRPNTSPTPLYFWVCFEIAEQRKSMSTDVH